MCVFIVHISHWFQLLHYSKAPSKTLAGRGVYTLSGAISRQEAYRLVDTGGSWGLHCTELGHELIGCSYSHLTDTQGWLKVALPYSRASTTSAVLQSKVHKAPLFNTQIQRTVGVSAMYLVLIPYYYCSTLLWLIFWPGGTTIKLLASSDEITLHIVAITTCAICAEVFDALRRCLESMNPVKKL